jgi:predicted TIM-barrel fold metal-dependent hydrolase
MSDVIDMHVHFGAPDDPESGCYWSPAFEKTAAYYAILLITGSMFKPMTIDRVREHLAHQIKTARFVNKTVLLALDEVYDTSGLKHREWTHLHVPNSYLAQWAQQEERILFGCSVHPFREDWEEQLNFSLQSQTVLCKWIPSSQLINPADDQCLPFYRKLADLKLPLLCHAGPEYAIPTSDSAYDSYNNPKYLRKALDLGVTVIIPHCALPYFWFLDADYQDHYREFLNLMRDADKKGWNLYADVSAIATPLRAPYIAEIIDKVSAERILFGSDYPIPLSEFTYNRSKNIWTWLRFVAKTMLVKNSLDKNYLVVKKMGFDQRIFTNASRLFSQIKY